MKHYMLFIREDLEAARDIPEAQLQAEIHVMVQWVESLSKGGHYVQGEPLETEVLIARKDSIVSDGPFIEAKEGVSGYMIIKAQTLEQAAAIAQGCPLMGQTVKSIEVRPILKF